MHHVRSINTSSNQKRLVWEEEMNVTLVDIQDDYKRSKWKVIVKRLERTFWSNFTSTTTL